MKRHAWIMVLLVIGALAVPATAQPPKAAAKANPAKGEKAEEKPDVTFEAETSQTSAWPGDRFHYRIIVKVPAGIKVSLDDFDRKAVNFKPFLLTDTSRITEEYEQGGGRYTFDYLLTNFEIGDRIIEIPRVIFHYQKVAAAGNKEQGAIESRVPPFPIAVRSTLNQPAKQAWIRETLPADITPSRAWILSVALGCTGLLLSSLPLLTWAWSLVPQWRARERKLSKSQFMRQHTRSLDALGKGLDKGSEEVRKQYQALEGIAHQYIRYTWNIDAAGLTGSELSGRLAKANISPKQSQVLGGVLDHGQNCRYSPANGTDWGTTFQQDLRDMKNALRG